jgi:acyl-CoA thioesterase-1
MQSSLSTQNWLRSGRTRIIAAVLAFGLLGFACAAQAETIRIVAIGSSMTAGQGVGSSAAWPAQLQAMLRAKGYDAQVANAGVNGDDSAGIRARLRSETPDGTQIVIIQAPGPADQRKGINTSANVAAMVSSLQARNIKSIFTSTRLGDWAGGRLQADGIHPTAAGHAAIAARVLPLVIAAIGKPPSS